MSGRRPSFELLRPESRRFRGLYDAFRHRPFRVVLGASEGEWLAVEAGLKPLIREVIVAENWEAWRARSEKLGLVTRQVATGVTESWTDGLTFRKDGFGDDGQAGAAEARQVLALAGREPGPVAEAAEIESALLRDTTGEAWRSLVERLGGLLGYPPCCVDAFARLGPRRDCADPIRASASRSRHFDPLLDNVTLSVYHHLGWFPCSYGCAPSRVLAARVSDLLLARSPAQHANVSRLLEMPRLYLDERRQLLLDALEVLPDRVRYRAVYTPGTFDGRLDCAHFDWVFFVDVAAPFMAAETARVGDDEIRLEKDGRTIAVLERPPEATWLPFGSPWGPTAATVRPPAP